MQNNQIESLLAIPESENFINAAYRTLLYREPDPTGFSHYIGRLASGASRQQILEDLSRSQEAITRDLPASKLVAQRKSPTKRRLRRLIELLKGPMLAPTGSTPIPMRSPTDKVSPERVIARPGLLIQGITPTQESGYFNAVLFWNFSTRAGIEEVRIQTGFSNQAKVFATGGKIGAESINGWLHAGTSFFAINAKDDTLIDALFIADHDLSSAFLAQAAKVISTAPSQHVDQTSTFARPAICDFFRIPSLAHLNIEAATNAIKLPTSPNPLVSIIIPTYGRPDLCLACLFTISTNPPTVAFEVLLVEDASNDPGIQALKRIQGLRFIEHVENLGFTLSCNAAVRHAKGTFLHFLNNDTEITRGWLDELLRAHTIHEKAGLVGSKLIYPDGRLQEAGGIVWRSGNAWNFGRMQDPTLHQFCYARPTDYCSAASILIEKTVFDQVGGFDPNYAPAYCEDTDLAFAVRRSGREVYFVPQSTVIHYEGLSHGRDENSGLKAYQRRNQNYFASKWTAELAHHYDEPKNLSLAKDRIYGESRKLFLVFDHYVPQHDRDAGSRTMSQVIQALLSLGYCVKFVPQNFWYDPVYTKALEETGVEVFYGSSADSSLQALLEDSADQIFGILLSRPEVAAHFLPLLRERTKATIFFYGHDIHHLRLRMEEERSGKNLVLRAAAENYKALEEKIWREVDVVLYPSSQETIYAQKWARREQVPTTFLTLPVFAYNSFDLPQSQPFSKRDRLLFVGGFRHRPNVQAAQWLVSEILPCLRSLLGSKTPQLLIIGSDPPDEVRGLSGDQIAVTGHISDAELQEHYNHAVCAVAPLLFGGGMKGKVIEAMRYGVPVVTTSVGAQGLEDANGFMAVADTPEAFAHMISELCENEGHWETRSRSGLLFIEEHFSLAALRKCFDVSTIVNPCTF